MSCGSFHGCGSQCGREGIWVSQSTESSLTPCWTFFFFFLTDSSLQNQLHNNQGPVKNENPWLLVQKLSRELSMGPPKHRALCDYAKFILPLFALPKPLSLSIWNLVSLWNNSTYWVAKRGSLFSLTHEVKTWFCLSTPWVVSLPTFLWWLTLCVNLTGPWGAQIFYQT
jgi:hypothetical protein